MLFTDPLFLFYFLPLSLVALRVAAWSGRFGNAGKLAIIVATVVFYAIENWAWVLIFAAIVGGTYLWGFLIARAQDGFHRRFFLGGAIFYCLAFLSIFKYLNWLREISPGLSPIHNAIVPWFGADGTITLPPGISFYVFEAVSYCFDLYRRKITPPRNPLDFLCFIAMFPRFIAGPIVRYADLQDQIRHWVGMRVAQGLSLFSVGFALKTLAADQFAVFVPYAFDVARPDFVQSWLGVAAYSMQLYFDFWAYSIMATGLGLCLGFTFPDNFRSPYHAASITEFWRRWHISLSSWLRDYVYIAFGGNRGGRLRTYANLLATMVLGGIWHGANFTFLAWGFYHGLLLAAERAVGEERLARVPRSLRIAVTLGLVAVGWTLFRSASFAQASDIAAGLVGVHGFAVAFNPLHLSTNLFAATCCVAGLAFCIWGERWLVRPGPIGELEFPRVVQFLLSALFLVSLVVSLSSSEIPFLYFQF